MRVGASVPLHPDVTFTAAVVKETTFFFRHGNAGGRFLIDLTTLDKENVSACLAFETSHH